MLPRIQGGDSRPFDERVSKETREFIRTVNRNPNVLHLPSQLPSTYNRQRTQRVKTRPSRPGTSGVAFLPSNHYSASNDRVLDENELQGLLQQADQLQGVSHADKMRPSRSRAAPRVSPPASHQSLRPTSKPTPPTTLPSLPPPASAPAHLFQLLNADKYAPRQVLSKYRAEALERAVSKRSGINARVGAHVEETEEVIERILPQNAIGAREEAAARAWASHTGGNGASAYSSRGGSAGWPDHMAQAGAGVEAEWGMSSRQASGASGAEVEEEEEDGSVRVWSGTHSASPHAYDDGSVLDEAQGAGGWSEGEWVTVPPTERAPARADTRAGSVGAPVPVPMSRTAAYMSEFLVHGPQSPHALLWGDAPTDTGTGAWSREGGGYRVTDSAVGVRVVCARGSDAERRRLNTTLGGQLAAVELHTLRKAFEGVKKKVKTLPTGPAKEHSRVGGTPHTRALRTLDELAAEISRNERSGISGVRNPNASGNLTETNADPAHAEDGVSEKSASESGPNEALSPISHLLSDIGTRSTEGAPAHAHIPLRLRDAATHTRAQVPPMVHTYAARATAPVDTAVCVAETLRGSAVDTEVCDGRLRLKLTIARPPPQTSAGIAADTARAHATDTATFLTATDVGGPPSTPSTAADEGSNGTGAFSSSGLSSSTSLTASPSTSAALSPQQLLGTRRTHAPMSVTAHTLTAGAYYPSRRVVHVAGASKGAIAGESSLLTQTTQPVRWAHDSHTHSKARKHSELIHKQPTRSKLLGPESKHALGKTGAVSGKSENFEKPASASDSASVSTGDLVITTDLLTSSLAVQPIDTFLHRAHAAARSLGPRADSGASTRTLTSTRALAGTQRLPPAVGGTLPRATSTRLLRTRTGTAASRADLRAKHSTSSFTSAATSSSSSSSSSKSSSALFLSPLPSDPLARARWLCALLAALPPRITENSLETIFPGLSPHARAAKARKLHALRQHLHLARSQASVPAWLWRNPRFRAALSLSSTALAASAMQVDAAERSELVVRRAVDWLCTHTPLLQLRAPANAASRAAPVRAARAQGRATADAPRHAHTSGAAPGSRSAAANTSAAASVASTSVSSPLSFPHAHPPPRGSATPRPSTHAYAQRPRVPTQRLSVHNPHTQRNLVAAATQRVRGPAQRPPHTPSHAHTHASESTPASAPAVHASLFSAVAAFLQLAHRGHPVLSTARAAHAELQALDKGALVSGGGSLDLSSMALALTRTRTHTHTHNILHASDSATGSGNGSGSGSGGGGASTGVVVVGVAVTDTTVDAGERTGTGTGTGTSVALTATNALAFLTSAHGHAPADTGADAADADVIALDTATASYCDHGTAAGATRAGARAREHHSNNDSGSGSGSGSPSTTATLTSTSTSAPAASLSPALHAISAALAPFARPSRNTWLASLSPALFRTIMRTATVATYRSGDVVYACGAAAGDIFLVLSGALVRRVGHTPTYVARYHGPGVHAAVSTATAAPAEAAACAAAAGASQYCSCSPVEAWAPHAAACASPACCLCCPPAVAPRLPLLVPAYAVAHAAQLGGVVVAHTLPPAVAARATAGGRGGIAGSSVGGGVGGVRSVGAAGPSSLLPLGPTSTPSVDADTAHSHALTRAPTQCTRVDTTAFTFLPYTALSASLVPLYPPPALALAKQPPAYASPHPMYLPVLPGATFGHEPLVRLYTCIQRAERKAFVQSLWRLLRLSVRAAGVLRRRKAENGALVYFSKHNNTYLPVFQKERARERGRRVKAFASVVAIGAECQRLLAPTDTQRQRHAQQEAKASVAGPAISDRAQPAPRVSTSRDASNDATGGVVAAGGSTCAGAGAGGGAGAGVGASAEEGLTLRCIMQAAALVRPQRGEAETEAEEFNGISGYLNSQDARAGSQDGKAPGDAHTQAQAPAAGRAGAGARSLDGRALAHAPQGHCAHCGRLKAPGATTAEMSASPPNLVSHSRDTVTEYSSPSSAHVLHRLDTVVAAAESVVVRISYLAFDTAILAHKRINVHAASLFLGTVPLFSRFSSSRLRRLHSVARIKAVLPGECVFRQGDPADMLAVVCQGRVALQRHCQVTHARKWPAAKAVWECEEYTALHSVAVEEIGPRGTCGAEVLLGCSHYDFTVVALPPQRAEGGKAAAGGAGNSHSNVNGNSNGDSDDMELHSNVFINLDDPSLVCPSLSPAPAATPSHARVVVLLIPARHLHYLSPLFPHMAADTVEHLRIKAALLTQKSLVQAFPKSHQRQPFPVCVWSKGTARADAALMHYNIDSLRSHAFVQAATLVRQHPHRSSLNHSGAGIHGAAQRAQADGSAEDAKTAAFTAAAAAPQPSAHVSLHGCVRVVCAQPQALETTGLVVRYDPPFTQLFPKAATHTHCTCRQRASGKGGDGSSATVAPHPTDSSPQAVATALHAPLSHALHRCPHQTHAPCRGTCECVVGESVRVGWVAAEDNVLVTEPIKVSYVVKAGKTRSYRGAAQ